MIRSRFAVAALAALVTLPLAACERRGESDAPSPGPGSVTAKPSDAPRGGFAEEALERGLDFRMHFLPEEQGPNFKMNLYDHGCGVCVEDADGDGDDDVYLLDQFGPNRLFRNDGGRFTDVTDASGTALAERISVGGVMGDLDGDGDADLFVTTTRGGNVLFRNDGGMRFTDVTKDAGVGLVAHSQSPLLFDADGDGDLDLLVTNTARWTLDTFREPERYWVGPATLDALVQAPGEPNAFYRNDGGLRFTEMAEAAGLAGPGWDGDAAPFDFDGDGDLDVFVANMFGHSRMMRNDGNLKFTDATADTIGAAPWGSIGSRVLDADGDGKLDLYVADMHSDMWLGYADSTIVEEKRRYEGPEGRAFELGRVSEAARERLRTDLRIPARPLVYGSALYRAAGGGRFEDVTERSQADTWWPWGVAVADFDMDCDEDIFLPTGMGYPWFYWRSSLLVNRGDGVFDERGRDFGIEPLPGGPTSKEPHGESSKSFRCAAVGDFDGDGRPDLVANAFNGRAHLWMNRFPAKRWIALRLTGTAGTREAVGALVTVRCGGKSQVRTVQPTGGYLSQSTRTLLFGLGDLAGDAEVEIRWPGGRVQKIAKLEPGRLHAVTEPR